MKITYDPQADALYLYVKEGAAKGTTEVNGDLLIDYDAKKIF